MVFESCGSGRVCEGSETVLPWLVPPLSGHNTSWGTDDDDGDDVAAASAVGAAVALLLLGAHAPLVFPKNKGGIGTPAALAVAFARWAVLHLQKLEWV